MAKTKTQYICPSCGTVHPRWAGQCSGCGEWGTLVEEQIEAAPKSMKAGKAANISLTSLNADIASVARISTGNNEVDRVLGGGLVPGSAILLGGDPGIGKSTLLLQLSAALTQDCDVLYVSGEESEAQVQLRAARLGLADAPVMLANATSVRDICEVIKRLKPRAFVVIDSIQTMFVDHIESAPGTVTQVRSSASELIKLAKKRDISVVLVGHVTKEGQLAGPRVLEHIVDTVLYFEGERSHLYRLIRSVKNRFGAAGEVGVFAMGEGGLEEVSNPSALFLSKRDIPVSGAAIHAGVEGSRPVLLELEALVSPSHYATPRRAVIGWDSARLAMMLAVLEARADVVMADSEVYLNVAGGFRISDPSADLAAAAALISAKLDIPLPAHCTFFGEIGLSGDVRAVPHAPLRLREAKKLGFKRAIVPPGEILETSDIEITTVAHVNELLSIVT